MTKAWIQDIHYAFRTLLRKPGFTATAVLALALGVGANTAIFSVVNGILLRPLPYPEQGRIMMIFEENAQQNRVHGPFSGADLNDLRNQSQSFEKLAAYTNIGFTLNDSDGAEALQGAAVSADFFSVLGVQPEYGRGFQAGEDGPQSPLQVVISHSLWQRHFNADPKIVGKVLDFGGTSHTVIGVMPADFEFPRKKTEVWRNMRSSSNPARGPYQIWAMGRLRNGIQPAQVQSELETISKRIAIEHPKENSGTLFRPISIADFLVGDVRTPLYLLLGAVAFVLMIASANVANLLLAKSAARDKEVAIRTALGAGRSRLVRQLMTESVVLATMGGLAGVGLAAWGMRLLIALAPANVFRIEKVHMDLTVLGFTALISLISGLLFGVVPALQATALDLNGTLKDGGRGNTVDGHRKLFRSLLIVSEVALSLVLLTGAGLTIRSYIQLQNVDPGFDPQNVLAVRMSVSSAKYDTKEKTYAFYTGVAEKIRTLPGVQSVGLTNSLPPIELDVTDSFSIEGHPIPEGQQLPAGPVLIVTPGYFEAMKIAVVRGRSFSDQDRLDSPEVVMINETLARRFFSGENPLGAHLKIGGAERPNTHWMEIVGVVRDVKYDGLDSTTEPAYYLPYAQSPVRGQDIVIRTATDPAALAGVVRNTIRDLDRDVPLVRVTTLDQRMTEAVGEPRFRTTLLGLFAAVALLLAAVGIYGVLSYSTALRTHEIGVRMSLGAKRSDVLRLVITEGMKLALAGVALGVIGSLALTRLMASTLFQISPTDPVTFIAVSALLLAVAFLACFIPARRATRVDPMVALHYE